MAAASADVITGTFSNSAWSAHLSIHPSKRRGSWVSIS